MLYVPAFTVDTSSMTFHDIPRSDCQRAPAARSRRARADRQPASNGGTFHVNLRALFFAAMFTRQQKGDLAGRQSPSSRFVRLALSVCPHVYLAVACWFARLVRFLRGLSPAEADVK